MPFSESWPVRFTGRALYQLHLVKSADARLLVPPACRLVELFGHTLGGLYVARYDSGPGGRGFDEAVVLAGLLWSPPSSCAWAARVFVSSSDAQRHGANSVGLPSVVASFSDASPGQPRSWWHARPELHGAAPLVAADGGDTHRLDIRSSARRRIMPGWLRRRRPADGEQQHHCKLGLPAERSPPPPAAGGEAAKWWQRPPLLRLSLPSFSGCTPAAPHLLAYSLALRCRVRLAEGMSVVGASQPIDALLSGRRLVTLSFEDMQCDVYQPRIVT